jgi:ribosomal protein S15P/S13E
MGRAIDMERDIDKLKAEIKTLKTAFDGLASTVETMQNIAPTRKAVDLHEDIQKEKKDKKSEKKLPKVVQSML